MISQITSELFKITFVARICEFESVVGRRHEGFSPGEGNWMSSSSASPRSSSSSSVSFESSLAALRVLRELVVFMCCSAKVALTVGWIKELRDMFVKE